MKPLFLSLVCLIWASPFSWAAESKTKLEDLRLDTITVTAESSFDSLSEESYVPVQKIKLQQTRSGTLDSLTKDEIYPTFNLGYPSGANGVNLGGRTVDDTQVFTLGVPLNLPQGGGADFSFFPAYLWSEVTISPTLSSAGFSPTAASGSIQLKPWTREAVRNNDPEFSRATIAYDRNLQTYSLATKVDRMAALAGMSTGLQSGPAGSFSYYFLRTPKNHILFHMIGSSQEGDSPGSVSFPTPNNKKETWRVIPVIESHQQITSELTVESTLYGDLQELQNKSPTRVYDTRTQQYGLENAILYRNFTLALSGRYVRYASDTQINHEWPVLSSLSGEFALNSSLLLKVTGGGDYLKTSGGFYPMGRVSLKDQFTAQQYWFAEVNTIPKMPTLVARFYPDDGYFHGNPSLKPERVNALLVGHNAEYGRFTNTLTLKGELRSDVQLDNTTTVDNYGRAFLTSLKNDTRFKVLEFMELNASTFLTYSRLERYQEPYPNLPYFSQLLGAKLSKGDLGNLHFVGRYTGKSRAIVFGGVNPHPDFFLFDSWVNYNLTPTLQLAGGVDNLFDSRAEVVLGYPLPGRVVYLSAQARF